MSKTQTRYSEVFMNGIWKQNPIFKQVLGTCPTLAVTVSVINGFAMGVATAFVLLFSSMIISLIKKLIPNQVRIAAYIVVIATFVTIVDIVMKAQFPDLSKALGPFIPLIIVNCIILGRAEAFASKNTVGRSILDALGMGAGFTLALLVIGGIREVLGSSKFLGTVILPATVEPMLIFILPAGAFLTLGILFGTANHFEEKKKAKEIQRAIDNQMGAKNVNVTAAETTETAEKEKEA
ncbi:MAG: electron transport complex subunit E [Ignavibacteriales bacterium]|nr:MAG: electron transport complex subunit E [Ignavibacteriaceae bacterium]MBW7873516.1 electron transport complex subunit E [Ignavibacteria bacterium]MCZ2142207.1 electron transport complex subunit E [Ignavibacteriales bacterium]MBV6444942.1 Electron transport complex subunit RnfE [Ignavibacteriaceae bacterium]MBZ0196692.1 electron transport complex subunit E [Ignavibacteriaceae bacterium]